VQCAGVQVALVFAQVPMVHPILRGNCISASCLPRVFEVSPSLGLRLLSQMPSIHETSDMDGSCSPIKIIVLKSIKWPVEVAFNLRNLKC
jgi:hypothetical protein